MASPKQTENLPLFYTKPEPLEATRHKGLALKKDFGLGFAKGANAVPINMIEFPQICHFYPIAFAPDANASPVAILGLRDGENLFLNTKGEWLSDTYIPAYLRRYPFIFSEQSGGDQLTLCIDAVDSVVEKNGEQKFFDDSGKRPCFPRTPSNFVSPITQLPDKRSNSAKTLTMQVFWWNAPPRSLSPVDAKSISQGFVLLMKKSWQILMRKPLWISAKKVGYRLSTPIFSRVPSGYALRASLTNE